MKIKILILSAAIIISVLIYFSVRPSDEIFLTGIADTDQIDVSSKLPGRICAVKAFEGDEVKKGDTLVILESKELDAKLGQGKGLVDAASAKLKMARNGARPEEIAAARALYLQADEQRILAEKTLNRVRSLYNDQVVSAQEKDQAEAQYKAATEQVNAAKARYDMAVKGARNEEIDGAEALFNQAKNTLGEISAAYTELSIISPADGEISKRLNDPGEIIPAGYPVMTIINLKKVYVTLSVKEDLLTSFKKNSIVSADIPALGKTAVRFRVSYLAAMADFATWKATNQKGDFDLKTFEVRLTPEDEIPGLRPGMTARIKIQGNHSL